MPSKKPATKVVTGKPQRIRSKANAGPRRLSSNERERLIAGVENAMNTGWQEARLFWTADLRSITMAPVNVSNKTKLSD